MSKHFYDRLSFDANAMLGRSCAINLINFNEEALKELPLGLDNGKLTDSFIKGFDSVIRNHVSCTNQDPKLIILIGAGKMAELGHNRYKLVTEHVLNRL